METFNVVQPDSVSAVNEKVRQVVEGSMLLRSVTVRGEISNLTRRAGKFGRDYLYFTLKDEKAQLSAVMFDGVEDIPFDPQNGDMVVCEGMISVYAAYGKYQIKCFSMSEDGAGDAALALAVLKQKLYDEGLFAQKRPLPLYPKKIAVITSPTGAAVQDIKNVISRRYPVTTLVIIPAYVQGENAVPSLIKGIKTAQSTDAELIIFGRGGGSSEDLGCFNSEKLARAIFASKIPTISAVGHEIDTTIADLAADMRAPTPSAAAELAVPDKGEILAEIAALKSRAVYGLNRVFGEAKRELALLEKDVKLHSPRGRISSWEQELARLSEGISNNIHRLLANAESALKMTAQSIAHLNPLGVLSRGYSLTSTGGKIIKNANELSEGSEIDIKFSEGSVSAVVKAIKE